MFANKNYIKIFIKYFLLCLFFITNLAAFADIPQMVTFPTGIMLRGILQNEISTESNVIGDEVKVIIPTNIGLRDINCIPKGTEINGNIVELQKAQPGQNGYFLVLFDKFKFLENYENTEIDMRAHIWTKANNGIIGGELTERTKYRKVPHYTETMGGIVKLIPVGPRKPGKETVLKKGTALIIQLDRDLTLQNIP